MCYLGPSRNHLTVERGGPQFLYIVMYILREMGVFYEIVSILNALWNHENEKYL